MYKIYQMLRDEQNMTDYEVSKKSGVSTATLSAWKYDGEKAYGYTPKIDKLMKIADALGVPVTVFFENGVDNDNKNN